MIQVPTLNVIAGIIGNDIDFDRICNARNILIETLLAQYESHMQKLYQTLSQDLPKDEKTSSREIGTRAYMNSLLEILSYSHNQNDILSLAESQYNSSRTMTLRL